ncbi:MAG: tRNA (adenosine(37)-N6)-threonylcarbamoyltransferase complex dimerization subunit type 1 TsaB [Bacilli bacterium]|nr:tRNA (adenosine(37)-N6)-threonylcarbamoyltransferase complex dimerization subunit type 1 TsaB [Bacilli bacterium]
MYSLFIDTHDKDINITLFQAGKVLESSIRTSERHHSDFTMPMIDNIIKNNNLTVHDLNEILVVNGPGSFTGVRLGVTIAKTLAYTLNIPIKTITSLESLAISNPSKEEKLAVIHDIKGVYGAIFKKNKLAGEIFYKSNDEFAKMDKDKYLIIEDGNLDMERIYEYMKNIKPTIAHKVNPLYVKVIEALKND